MTIEQIDAEVIEAAVLALVEVYGSARSSLDEAAMEAALIAADEKRGIKKVFAHRYPSGAHSGGYSSGDGIDPPEEWRYVSDWRDIAEQAVEDIPSGPLLAACESDPFGAPPSAEDPS